MNAMARYEDSGDVLTGNIQTAEILSCEDGVCTSVPMVPVPVAFTQQVNKWLNEKVGNPSSPQETSKQEKK
jgi:hypothetical protein